MRKIDLIEEIPRNYVLKIDNMQKMKSFQKRFDVFKNIWIRSDARASKNTDNSWIDVSERFGFCES